MKNWNGHLDRFATAPHCIAIEVTEDVLLNASSMVVDKLKALHRAGVQLTLDRFGSGYSPMSCLKAFDVDYLKIDPVLVQDSMASPDRRSVAEAVIVLAHALGLKVIAEGVESVEQRDWLRTAGCDYAQGYFFSRPLAPPEFATLLTRERRAPPVLHS